MCCKNAAVVKENKLLSAMQMLKKKKKLFANVL